MGCIYYTRQRIGSCANGANVREEELEFITHKKLKGGHLMPWGRAR
jgi:hypothetical protein